MALTLLSVLSALVWAVLVQKLHRFVQLKRKTYGQPGFFSVLQPTRDWATLLGIPHWKWLNIQEIDAFKSRFTWFEEANSSVIGITSILPVQYCVNVADPAALAYILSPQADNTVVERSVSQELALLTFIDYNTLASEGATWKRHRLNSAKAFTNKNFQLVWESTQRTLAGWFADVAKHSDEKGTTHVSDIGKVTVDMTLDILLDSAFGSPVEWASHAGGQPVIPPGHQLDFRTAMEEALAGLFQKALLPDFVLRLWPSWRRIRLCYLEWELYLREMATERRALKAQGADYHDLLSCLIEGSDTERPERKLSETELFSNMFVFMLAGHETSAHALSHGLQMLAMFPEIQEKCYEETLKVLPDNIETLSSLNVLTDLPVCKGVAHETLRLFPPAVQTRRSALTDLTVPCSTVGKSPDEPMTTGQFFIPKGSHINVAITALHHNPAAYESPFEFKPDRYGPDATPDPLFFRPFGGASRVCIGQRFATIELISAIAHITRHYKISLTPKRQAMFKLLPGETEHERYNRFFSPSVFVTLQHGVCDIVMTRRL